MQLPNLWMEGEKDLSTLAVVHPSTAAASHFSFHAIPPSLTLSLSLSALSSSVFRIRMMVEVEVSKVSLRWVSLPKEHIAHIPLEKN